MTGVGGFFGHAVLRVQSPVFFQCFWVFRARNLSPRSLAGGGVPPDAQDLHPQHHQDYLVANEFVSFFCRY